MAYVIEIGAKNGMMEFIKLVVTPLAGVIVGYLLKWFQDLFSHAAIFQ